MRFEIAKLAFDRLLQRHLESATEERPPTGSPEGVIEDAAWYANALVDELSRTSGSRP